MRLGPCAGLITVSALAIVGYLATGVETVGPGEVVVVRRLGRLLETPWAEGVHLGWPAGFERRDRLRVDEVRQLEIGDHPRDGASAAGAAEYLTADRNLVQARVVVQYRVADPAAFLLRGDAGELLSALAQASVSRALDHYSVDTVLRDGRPTVAATVLGHLRQQAQTLSLGAEVLSVSLVEARPPEEVAQAFAQAQSAGSEKDQRLIAAGTQAKRLLTAAKADAQSRVEQARAIADTIRAQATGQSERFLALLTEARANRPLTTQRLYHDSLQALLSNLRQKLIVQSSDPIDLSILRSDR